jgi:TolA-binding protein
VKNFKPSIDLYRKIQEKFPDYRYTDIALYLEGYCLREMDEWDESIKVFKKFVEKYPASTYTPEVIIRLGDASFDMGEYDAAISYYAEAMKYEKSKWYITAFYKQAWSYFQKYDYPTAINSFKKLIEYVDALAKKGADSDQIKRGVRIRDEALTTIAGSLAEDDWDNDGERDQNCGVPRALSYLSGGTDYEHEILIKYADILFGLGEEKKYMESVDVLKRLLDEDKLNPKNPEYQEKIIYIYDTLKAVEPGIKERQKYISMFGSDTPWFSKNRERGELTTHVDREIEKNIRKIALFHHQHAQELKLQAKTSGDDSYNVAALESYRLASKAYSDYIERYPHSRYVFEMLYYIAETFYYSFDYDKGAEYYLKVLQHEKPRLPQLIEMKLESIGEFMEIVASSIIGSYEKNIDKQIIEGRLPKESALGEISEVKEEQVAKKEGEEDGIVRLTPEPMPTLTEKWILGVDDYLNRGFVKKNDPSYNSKMEYRVAMEYFKYRHMDEARKRFEKIIDKYPNDIIAGYAAANIVNSYKMERDWDNIAKWAKILETKNLGKPEEAAKLKQEVKLFQLGAQFKKAEKLFAEEKFEEAAQEFVGLVNEDPKNKFADKALYNAAISYQKIHKYDSASNIFERIITDYDKSEYFEDAIFQLGENSKKFYNFERAINSYLALVKRFPASENAPYCLFTAASLLDYTGKTNEAAAQYENYYRQFGQRDDASEAVFRAAKTYEKLNDSRNALRLYDMFVNNRTFSANPKLNEKIIMAYAKMAEIYDKEGNNKKVTQLYNTIISEFNARVLEPGIFVSQYPAKAKFMLIEPSFKEYEALKIKGNMKQMEMLYKKKEEMKNKLALQYADVVPYKALEWTAAAFYRIGYLSQNFAKTIYEIPIPENLSDEPNIDAPEIIEKYGEPISERELYTRQIEEWGMTEENKAIKKYEEAIEGIKKLKVVNQWTKKILEALNDYKPAEYPLFKEEKRLYKFEMLDGIRFDTAQ